MVKTNGNISQKSKFCFLSNFPPRECGIATFTRDLSFAMDKRFNPKLKSQVVALNEDSGIYNYDKRVIMQINKENVFDYVSVAENINNSPHIKLVCIQHEFGIFGGDYGENVLNFLDKIKKPVVVTFHSVLPEPDEQRRKIVSQIAEKSSGIIVMAKKAIEILHNDYGIEREKIHVVYHGVPNIPLQQNIKFKKMLGLEGKTVLSTFGLLSRGKGIEYMIRALPNLIKKYPNLVYLIIGETHPVVREEEGESYRKELVTKIKKLGLSNHVRFCNKYLSLKELLNYILASDVYICTNLEQNQIVSGTLSYALACGRAVVSTPSVYASEVLQNERGVLSEFKKPKSYANAIDKILSDENFKNNLEKNAYSFSREFIWPNVAAKYLSVFNKIVSLRDEVISKYPQIKIKHLIKMTDKFGMLQFSKHWIPDKKSGYTVDDNARALIAAVLHHKIFSSKKSLKLSRIFLDFLDYAQQFNGNFQNNFHNKNEVLDSHSEDSFGRALWGLGYSINNGHDEIRDKARELFDKSFRFIKNISNPRARAFSLIGLCNYYEKHRNTEIKSKITELAEALVKDYETFASDDWKWFEDNLTYSNAKIPEALLLAYEFTENKKYLEISLEALNFLSDIIFVDDNLAPIGQDGWYHKKGERAFFDQQAVDASAMVQAHITAYRLTGNVDYYNKAVLAFNWFLGRNHLNQMMYDESTGGCYDGLSENRVNLNQGAESCVSYLIARLMLEETKYYPDNLPINSLKLTSANPILESEQP